MKNETAILLFFHEKFEALSTRKSFRQLDRKNKKSGLTQCTSAS